jgi:glyoxylase-like metal-dependent hydrolase (beta-lactamase superfamily II)
MQFNRRDLLRAGVGAAAGMTLFGCASTAARPAKAKSSTTPLSERLLLISGLGANLLALRGDEGLLLVDTGAPDATGRLQEELTKFAGAATVATVINTHWHEANTGGNDVFGTAGAKIISHAKAAQRMAIPQYVPWEDRYLPVRQKVAVPREVIYYGSKELTFGGERIEYGNLQQAHTDGDIYVWFKDSNVLAVGDVAAPVSDPLICWYEGGWVGGRADSQAKLLTIGDEQTKIVASTGGVISRAELKTEMDAMTQMFERVSDAMRKGFTTEDMQRGKLLDGLPRTWADPDKALYDAHKSMWAHYNKLSHTIV